MNQKSITLKPGREKSVLQMHPWIFSGAVDRVRGEPGSGETVEIFDHHGQWLARAAYSPQSQMRARVWTWKQDEEIDRTFFARRLKEAFTLRQQVIPAAETDALRLVHAESDGLPGLILDQYGDWLVMQCLTAGAEAHKNTIANMLQEMANFEHIYERSDVDVRQLEGLADQVGVLRGGEPPELINVHEQELVFGVDVRHGHKTGFYLDQRHNRQRVRQLSSCRRVLNCFCYTGAFSIYAHAGEAAEVISVDSSAEVLTLAQKNLEMNTMSNRKNSWLQGDVFQILRTSRDRAEQYDMIILDPPKFAHNASLVQRAARGYKDINLLAFKLLSPSGLLVTFSCSGGVTPELFQKIVAGAALDAGKDARIIETLTQGSDHPVALNFPEGAYLKGFVVQVSS